MLGYLPLFHRFTLFMTMFVKIGFVIGKLLDSCGVRAARPVRFGVRGGSDSSCWVASIGVVVASIGVVMLCAAGKAG